MEDSWRPFREQQPTTVTDLWTNIEQEWIYSLFAYSLFALLSNFQNDRSQVL